MTITAPATTSPSTSTWNAEALQLIQANTGEHARPVLLAGARLLTLDPLTGDFPVGDVLYGGNEIFGVGPGLTTAAADDDMIVVDCTGMTVVPAVLDIAALRGLRADRAERVATLSSGNAVDLAIIPTEHAGDLAQALDTLVNSSERVMAQLAAGRVARWDATDLPTPSDDTSSTDPQDLSASPYLGVWIDESDFLHQELTADGRYDETRGGRPHAFQGRFWITGTRIDYLDDLGFWAFGEFVGDRLHHVTYRMHRN